MSAPAPVMLPGLGPIGSAILLDEVSAGRRPVLPDAEPPAWLELDDWRWFPLLAYDAREVHVLAIWSARRGAFTRLVAGIEAAGLVPVVVAPLPFLRAILVRKGWRETVKGWGPSRREEWRPPTASPTPAPGSRTCAGR